jgi:hypothetical protein
VTGRRTNGEEPAYHRACDDRWGRCHQYRPHGSGHATPNDGDRQNEDRGSGQGAGRPLTVSSTTACPGSTGPGPVGRRGGMDGFRPRLHHPDRHAVGSRNIYRDFVGVCERAKLGRWHPHELHHSAASIMLSQGMPIEVVSEILGHSSIRMTADVYGHILEPQRLAAAGAMAEAMWSDVVE